MAVNEETGRLNVQLLADVFTDLDEVTAAFATGAGFRLMPMFNAGQSRRQRIAAGAFVLTRCCGRLLLLLKLGDDGSTILIAGIGKQITRLTRQGFTLATKANAFMVRQFERELLDLQFAPLEFSDLFCQLGIAFDEPALQGRDLRLSPVRQRRMNADLGCFGAGIHAWYYTIREATKPRQYWIY